MPHQPVQASEANWNPHVQSEIETISAPLCQLPVGNTVVLGQLSNSLVNLLTHGRSLCVLHHDRYNALRDANLPSIADSGWSSESRAKELDKKILHTPK